MDYKVLTSIGLPLKEINKISTRSLNECYHLRNTITQEDLFLKILSPTRSAVDRLQELNVQKLASSHGCSPELLQYEHDDKGTWLLLKFYTPLDSATLAQQVFSLQQFHTLAITQLNKVDPLAWAYYYLEAARAIQPALPILQVLEKNLASLILPEFTELSVCHFDVHPYNFLMSSEHVYLIDFENAGVFDALYDVAVFAFYLGFDQERITELLARYRPHYSAQELQRCLDYQIICLNLFLAYLTYQLIYRGENISFIAINPAQAQKEFQQLIKTYYLPKSASVQTDLEKKLLSLGLSFCQDIFC